jgi:nucleoside-diphosphate-sugar epimerase
MKPLLEEDITFMLDRLEDVFCSVKGAHFFLTGATGLIGKWILEVLLQANLRLQTEFQITALSRNPEHFKNSMPHLANKSELMWIQGNASDFKFPIKPIDFIIHAAAEVQNPNQELPSQVLLQQIRNTEHVLELCRLNPRVVLLFTSSGAVYGRIPSNMTHVMESYAGAPDVSQIQSGYGEGKRVSEFLLASAATEFGLNYKISRTFAVVGAHLPLHSGFAIGNFIRDALAGQNIVVSGDSLATRSYLYMAEHTIWILKILISGISKQTYNVVSDISYSINEVALAVSKCFNNQKVNVLQQLMPEKSISRYVPNIEKIKKEFGIVVEIPLDQAIQRTSNWLH